MPEIRGAVPDHLALFTDLTRDQVLLTDEEFEAFMACRDVHPELHTLALVSSTLGGARTSDLHAGDWSHIDVLT